MTSKIKSDGNSGFGAGALDILTSGSFNTALGQDSQGELTNGSRNASVGRDSLWRMLQGDGNTAIGDLAGENLRRGTNNTYIGERADGPTNISYSMAQGHFAHVTKNRQWVVGTNDGILGYTQAVFNVVNLGINTNSPTEALQVHGKIKVPLLATNEIVITTSSNTLSTATVGSGLSLTGGVLTATGGVGAATSPGGTNMQVQFNQAGVFGGATNLWYDSTTGRLGVNTNIPQKQLHVFGPTLMHSSNNLQVALTLKDRIGGSSNSNTLECVNGTSGYAYFTVHNNGDAFLARDFRLGNSANIGGDTSANTNSVPLNVQGISGQWANIQQWRDPNSNVLARLDKDGTFTGNGGNFQGTVSNLNNMPLSQGTGNVGTENHGWASFAGYRLVLIETNDDYSGAITLTAPDSIVAGYTLTFPATQGGASEVLTNNGSGVLGWSALSGSPGGTNMQVQYNDNGVFNGATNLLYNKTTGSLILSGATPGTITLTGTNASSSNVIGVGADGNGITNLGYIHILPKSNTAPSLRVDVIAGQTSNALEIVTNGVTIAYIGNGGRFWTTNFGSAAAPAYGMYAPGHGAFLRTAGEVNFAANSAEVFRLGASQLQWGGGAGLVGLLDAAEGANILQVGDDAAGAATGQIFKGPDAGGADSIGGKLTLAPGRSTGTGGPARVTISVGTNHTASGSAAQGYATTNLVLGGTLSVGTTTATNASTGEDNLMSYAVQPQLLSANGDYIEIFISGTFAGNANNKNVRIKFGATTIFSTGALAFNGADWDATCRIIRTGATTQKASVRFLSSSALMASSVDYTTPAETLAGSITFQVTGEATADADITQESQIVRFWPR